jgi:transglutaminase-like putative cysteine protease
LYLQKPPGSQLSGVLLGIPSGPRGIATTVRVMRDIARHFQTNLLVRERAAALTQHLPQKAWAEQVEALHRYVRDGIRYLPDPEDSELVQTPVVTMQLEHGDCDDKATLLAALLKSIRHPARYVAVGYEPGKFSHVYVETRIGERWIPLETTAPFPAGFAGNLRPVTKMIVRV